MTNERNTRVSQTCKRCDQPTAGAKLCVRCCKTLAFALANSQAYYEDLDAVAGKAVRYGSGASVRGSIGKSQPLPVDLRFINVTITDDDPNADGHAFQALGSQVRFTVWNSVTTWCRVVMEEAPRVLGPVCDRHCLHTTCAAVRRTAWPRSTVRSMLAYFDRQFRWIVRTDWCADFLKEMLDNENQMRKLIDRPVDRWYAGKCSAADEHGVCEAELYAVADSGTVRCPTCGTDHDIAARRDFLLLEAQDYLVTATEAAQALIAWTDYDGTESRLADQIQKWRDRERLEVRDVTSLNGRDRHLYRLGDIQLLLIAAAQHAQAKRVKSA